jgi:hypothetical protein
MCRYAFKVYKSHFTCFNCRKTFKESYSRSKQDKKEGLAISSADFSDARICPQCKDEMIDLGLDFKTPKQNDLKQWKKVEILYQYGFTFHSCGCCGPGLRPNELSQVEEFLKNNLTKSDGEKLLELIAQKSQSRNLRK